MRVPELSKEELLIGPEQTDTGHYDILQAERFLGTPPLVIDCPGERMMNAAKEYLRLKAEIA